MNRKLRRIVPAIPALILTGATVAAVLAPASAGAYPTPDGRLPAPQRITHPIILLVTRHRAIQLMQQGDWCTRVVPGVFECTAGAP